MCTLSKLPGDTDAVGIITTPCEPLDSKHCFQNEAVVAMDKSFSHHWSISKNYTLLSTKKDIFLDTQVAFSFRVTKAVTEFLDSVPLKPTYRSHEPLLGECYRVRLFIRRAKECFKTIKVNG